MNSKEKKLLEAGMFYFSINGVDATRVEDITKKAGVAKGTFYNYFSSKEALLEKIMIFRVEKNMVFFNSIRGSEASFEEKIIQYLRERFNKFIEDPKTFYTILTLTKTGEIMLLKNLKEKLGSRGEKLIREFFEENIEHIKEEYREELRIIAPSIVASLFTYQDIIAERIGIKVKKEEDYEEVSRALKKINIERYIQQFYKLNIKEMIKEG